MPEPRETQRAVPEAAARPVASIYIDPNRPAPVTFLLERQEQRLGGAMGVSVLSHVAAVFLAILIVRLVPAPSAPPLPDLRNHGIVWLPLEGPGGGGGGGGDSSPEPPQKVELPGEEAVSVPVVTPPKPAPPQPDEPEPPPIEQLTIPALTAQAGDITVPGTLEGLTAPPVPSQGSGTQGGGGTGRGTGIGPGEGSGLGPGSGGGTGGGVFRPGAGISLPRPIREVKPQYTSEAMRAKIQGEVWLEAVVLPDGSVGNVEVVRSLDPTFGLDEEAKKAARQWRFAPGTRFGQPVPVLVVISMSFTLR